MGLNTLDPTKSESYSLTVSRTHRGQSEAGCGTSLYEALVTCRLLVGPENPSPDFVDFVPWSAPSPLA